MICAAFRLVLDLGDHHPSPARPTLLDTWTTHCRDLAVRAADDGDLRPGTDPNTLADAVVATAFGSRVLARSPDALTDVPHRMTQAWQLLLPAVTDPANLDYFHQFALRREPHPTAPVS
ncbi:TetR family transcriptional regulator [Rhodococcus opacus]|uniref:TetR family transcriptional regulator n=1 Tax=Rhodococcus opacus TaxID=37919 RepID=UPI00211DA860|nr:TetR family transcriptional regulator [Rhodococcus opacus]